LSWRHDTGQVIVVLALALPLLLGMAALVIDLGNAFVQRRSLQNAADAAALAAAQGLPCTDTSGAPSTPCQNAVAQLAGNYVASNVSGISTGSLPKCNVSAAPCYEIVGGGAKVRVKLATHVSTFFGAFFGKKQFDVSTRAAAVRFDYTSTGPDQVVVSTGQTIAGHVDTVTTTNPGPLPCGLCLLSSTISSIRGNNALIVNGSDLIANKTFDINGNSAQISADHIKLHDPYTGHDVFNPDPTYGGSIPDPLAYLSPPSFNDTVVPTDALTTGAITPRVYRNLDGNGRTFAPGVYTIVGTLSGAFNAPGVLFYFPSCKSHFKAFGFANANGCTSAGVVGGVFATASNKVVSVSPPTAATCAAIAATCPYVGLSVFYDRDNGTATAPAIFVLQANASSTIKGTFYGLNVQLDFGGGPTLAVSSAFVVGSYNGHGNPGLTINYDQSGNVQPPTTTTTTTTTQGVTNPGSTTTIPGAVTTVGTGSNLDE